MRFYLIMHISNHCLLLLVAMNVIILFLIYGLGKVKRKEHFNHQYLMVYGNYSKCMN